MSAYKILIVEDESRVAAFIKMGLEECGYDTDIAYDGMMGKSLALSIQYDLIVLDINLPHVNGFQLCKIIREKNIQTPILMLTALGRMEDKLQGFEYGADDYLSKPFEFKELIARIKALLKRSRTQPILAGIIRIADLEINLDAKTITRAGIEIELRSKEYTLLEYMATKKGKVISRSELIENVWGTNFDINSNVVDVYINFLRNKMDKNFTPQLIHTRVGMGYVLKDL
ncbi:MAG: response regulator transcription factor [Bacteroidetes bacterium]|nr:response regulator transcription factor [Bacteroidota bacterium]